MPTRHYSALSFLAGVYALAYAALLVASVGDRDHEMNLQAWFSWHACHLVVAVADETPLISPETPVRCMARLVMSGAATAQSLGFFVWAVRRWAYGAGSVAFHSAAAGVLGAMVLLGALMTAVTFSRIVKMYHR